MSHRIRRRLAHLGLDRLELTVPKRTSPATMRLAEVVVDKLIADFQVESCAP